MVNDTIAAIATALSESGIGIIRVSGPDAIEMVDKIFITPKGKQILRDCKSHTVHYGFICDTIHHSIEDYKNHIIDEVLVTIFKGPKSFTAEDTVEINCHGGIIILQTVLKLVLACGAKMAEPGEFTKRAFLNGRIDLTKAEAVMDLIHSKNEYARKASLNQLTGSFSSKLKKMREEILYEIAFIESALDDPEHISLDGYQERLYEKISLLIEDIDRLLKSTENGLHIKEGINTVILGKPNAGKSSLLNLLSGQEKAIVTDIEGTTRDVLEVTVNIEGITLNISDTAGIRQSENIVEQMGVDLAKKYAANSDLVLYVIDASRPFDENDKEIISLLTDKKIIVLMNKNDLSPLITEKDVISLLCSMGVSKENYRILSTSFRNEIGLENIEDAIVDFFFEGKIVTDEEIIITNLRHKEAMEEAKTSLTMVLKSIKMDMPEDFYSIDLMNAYRYLGYILGEEVEDDVVNMIFSKFCMGK